MMQWSAPARYHAGSPGYRPVRSLGESIVQRLSLAGVAIRFVASLALVLLTYNPSGHSFLHWSGAAFPHLQPLQVVAHQGQSGHGGKVVWYLLDYKGAYGGGDRSHGAIPQTTRHTGFAFTCRPAIPQSFTRRVRRLRW